MRPFEDHTSLVSAMHKEFLFCTCITLSFLICYIPRHFIYIGGKIKQSERAQYFRQNLFILP